MNDYAIGSIWKVRNMKGIYKIQDSYMMGKKRRYQLVSLTTDALYEKTEAFGEDLKAATVPVAKEEPAITGQLASLDAMPASDASDPSEPANAAEGPVAGPSAAHDGPRDTLAANAADSTRDANAPRSIGSYNWETAGAIKKDAADNFELFRVLTRLEVVISDLRVYLARRGM
jgi:hypothetical protein